MHGAPCLGYTALGRLPAVKWATQVELYRSLVLGRRYLETHFGIDASIHAAARAACMSPYHFNRLFRALFRQTPYEFLTAVRMAEARRLLRSTSRNLNDIALSVGFKEHASFSRVFKRRQGISPSRYRHSATNIR